MKKCPTNKELLQLLQEDSNILLTEHLERCPTCNQQAEEARRLDSFFQDYHRQLEAPPFMWTRIESRLSAPVTKIPWYKNFIFSPSAVAAVALALICVSLVWVGFSPVNNQLTDEDILLAIESAQADSHLDLDHNPFNGKRHQLVELEKNPFQALPRVNEDSFNVDENPFEQYIQR